MEIVIVDNKIHGGRRSLVISENYLVSHSAN